MPSVQTPSRVAIVGGGGHVGLPLGLVLCDMGHVVTLIDSDPERLREITAGRMPFYEKGGEALLLRCLAGGRLASTTDRHSVAAQEIVIVTIGTPVDEYLDPNIREFDRTIEGVLSEMRPGQLLMIRSTVFPGVTDRLQRRAAERGLAIDVCYCPERIAQGYAIDELTRLPQLVAGCTPSAQTRAERFFTEMGIRCVPLTPVEAELAKLFTNSYRYINFAISNQFYMIADSYGADFHRVYRAVTDDYPRMNGFARSGFAGGPCLLKDTMQLASFNHNLLTLGHHAMMVNEGLPSFLVSRLKQSGDLSGATVGILGMAFKGNSDDPRSSLSYKLRKVLTLECRRVLCTDPFIDDPSFVTLETALDESDILILGACHNEYREIRTEKPVVDVFGFLGR